MPKLSQKSDDKWRFRCYDPGRNRGGFHKWYDAQAPEIQAEIDSVVTILAATRHWDRPLFAELAGHCEGLSELIVEVGTDEREILHVRILGFLGPKDGDFTMLRGFIKESGSEYGRECQKAKEWMRVIMKDRKRAPEFEN